MAKVRVVRILEYTYESAERAEEDMGKWYIPANGKKATRGMPPGIEIRSASFMELFTKEQNIEYSKDAPNLIADSEGNPVGIVTQWNSLGVGECIVQYFDGSADSALFTELRFPNGRFFARQYLNEQER